MKRAIASRRIFRGNVGFTLAELLVATFLGLVVVTSIYLVLIGSSQQYALQQQIVAAQESMRFSMDFMKNEMKGFGRMSVANGILPKGAADGLGVRDPSFCPIRSGIQGIELFENDLDTPSILANAPNSLSPDRLRFLKDAPGATVLTIQRIAGRTVSLARADRQPTEVSRRLADTPERMSKAFAAGHYLMVLSRSGLTDFVPIADFRFAQTGSEIDLTETPCDLAGASLVTECAFDGCLAAPVQLVEYRVQEAPDNNTVTQLVRQIKDARSPTDDLNANRLVLADYVVNFQVLATIDQRTPAQIENRLAGLGSGPIIVPDDDPRDDRGNGVGDTESEAINEKPEKIRSLEVILSVRTAREDEEFLVAIDRSQSADSRQPLERNWFDIDGVLDTGLARVTTLSFSADTPNLYRGPE